MNPGKLGGSKDWQTPLSHAFGLMVARTEYFFQCRDSLKCFKYTIFQQGPHAEQAGLPANGLRRFAVEGHFADGGVQPHQLEDSEAPTVASVMTVGAAAAAHERGRGCAVCRDTSGLQLGGGWLVRLLAF